jgi:predicted nucleotidyltransferase
LHANNNLIERIYHSTKPKSIDRDYQGNIFIGLIEFWSGFEAHTITEKCLVLKKINRMQPIIEQRKEELKAICERLKIRKLYAFGSAVTSDKFRDNSDIDFLISFEDSISPEEYSENYFQLMYRLRELFNREIDVITERSLSNPYFIESVNKNKVLIYEA